MIEFNVFWAISLALFLVAFFTLILIAKLSCKPIDSNPKIFSRIFPFELINHMDKGFSLYRIILFIFGALCFSPIFLVSKDLGLFQNFKVSAIMISSVFGLAGILLIFLHFFNPNNVKIHVILNVFYLAATMLAGLLTFGFSISLSKTQIDNGFGLPINIVFGGVALFSVVAILIFCATGGLTKWAKLEKTEDGLRRPNVFPLALLEWITTFALVIEETSFFLVLLKI